MQREQHGCGSRHLHGRRYPYRGGAHGHRTRRDALADLQLSAAEVGGGHRGDKFTEVLSSVGVLLVVGPIALTVFVLAYRRRLSSPATGMGVLFGSLFILWVLMTDAMKMLPQGIFQILLIPALLASILFGLPFVLTAAVLCVHHVFRTADVHEVLRR